MPAASGLAGRLLRSPRRAIGRDRADEVLATRIRAVHAESKGRYGAPRVHAELARRGHRHGRKRIARLMRARGLQGKAARRWKRTTIPDSAAPARTDLIRRDFTADASRLNTRWCGDITYIPTGEGWVYLSPSSTSPPAGSPATPWAITCAPN